MKKIVITFFIFLILIAGALYYYFSNSKEETSESLVKTEKLVFGEPSVSPINSYDNSAVWFGLNTGRMMRYDIVSEESTEYPLPSVVGQSFMQILWPPSGNDFIARGIVNNSPVYTYFNYDSGSYKILPENVVNLDWMKDGERIAVIWKGSDGKVQLVTSNPDATDYKVIRELPWADFNLMVSPSNDTALLVRPIPSGEVNKIYLFELDSGEYTEIVSEGRNNSVLWSPKGDGFVYTRIEDGTVKLYHFDLATKKNKYLEAEATIEKVSYSEGGNSLYIIAKKSETEELREYSIVNGSQKILHTFSTNMRPKNPLVINQKIFYINQKDGFFYTIQ